MIWLVVAAICQYHPPEWVYYCAPPKNSAANMPAGWYRKEGYWTGDCERPVV